MTVRNFCHTYARAASIIALVGIVTTLALLRPGVSDAAGDDNNPPTNIICQGWQRDTVRLSWQDNDNDEVNYRVERAIDGAAFTEIATVSPDMAGAYAPYYDLSVDVNKRYQYRVRGAHGDGSFTGYSPVCSKRRILDTSTTPNNGFRIFYGLEGTSDDCPAIDGNRVCLTNTNGGDGVNVFVNLQKIALEGSADAFTRVGFDRDAAVPIGGVFDKTPVNVVWCDGGGCAGGSSATGYSLGLSPFLMETAFDLAARTGDPIAYLVGEHETFHFQQYAYGGLNDPADGWVYEGQARSSQDKICIGDNRANALCFDDIATGYAGYVPEINGYLANTATSINRSSYAAALFWTYLTEKYGTSAPGDGVEGGMNLMAQFWKESASVPNRDGIAILNSALQTLGTPMRFRDIWKDFAVANFAKNLTGAKPAKYTYADMAQAGGAYGPVTFTFSQTLPLNVPFLQIGQTVQPWAARYYNFSPAANVPVLDIRISQDTNVPLYYTVLGIKNNGIAFEFNSEGRNLNQTLLNNAYSQVVVIVAGLENLANYRVSVNGTLPTLSILNPTTANKARVGPNTAPEKFRVAVQVLAPDGNPLTGVDLANFSFRVGTKTVAADQILTSAKIQDQQWFVIRAPSQDNPGQYDLRVDYSGLLSATQSLAVDYTPRTDADNMLVIDRSGSMAGPKMEAAKNAARLYVDSWRLGDKLGVVSFDHMSTVNMTLKDWSDSGANTRQEAFNAIDGLTPGGATHIGDALTLGYNQLSGAGNPVHDWAIVLLSDGLEDDGGGPAPTVTFDAAIANIAGLMTKRPVIHAVAIGPNADGPRMQAAAMATGGTYQFVSAPVAVSAAGGESPDNGQAVLIDNARLDLDARYRYIATEVLGHQQFFTFEGPLTNDGDIFTDLLTIHVEGSAAELILSLSFDGGCVCTIQLRDRDGTLISPAESTSRHFVWRRSQPKAGDWKLFIDKTLIGPNIAAAAPQQGEQLKPYLVQAAVKSDVILDVDLPVPAAQRVSGVPMPIVAGLTEFGPILGASVLASIVTPMNETKTMLLYDDGLHGDGAPNDGLYANTFYQTGVAGTESGQGSYQVTVTANGNSANAGAFVRQKLLGFFIFSSGDDDADLLPNEYEKLHTGANTGLDPSADPDGDGRSTIDEWQDGTDPLDPDSDNGGESDGSEQNRGSDPRDPGDDMAEPTWAVAYPGINKVFVRYAPRAAYTIVQIWRSETITGPYSLEIEEQPPTGMVTDTGTTNGAEYCYYAIGITAGGALSAPLTPSCATPSDDPWPPDGGFLINNGAERTATLDVALTLFASDAVSPHADAPEAFDDIMRPPSSSASSVTEMRISNFGDMRDGVFVPFATSAAWTLGQSSGLATVYVQYRDATGNMSRMIPNSILIAGDSGSAALSVYKTGSTATARPGETITYTYRITNTGDVNLTNLAASDDKLGAITLDTTSLTPGASAIGSATYTVKQSDLPGPLTNIVTATATGADDQAVSGSDSASVTLQNGGGGGPFSVGGTVTGLTGSGLMLRNNGGDDLAIGANGAFTFDTELPNGAAYAVTIEAQPAGQTCTVATGSGTISGANVTNVAVTCGSSTGGAFSVGGTVTGLTGSGLTLRNNGGDDLAIGANGAFTFDTELPNGAAYAVVVGTQPTGQRCTLTNGSGNLAADVTNVTVTCGPSSSSDSSVNLPLIQR